MSERTVAGLTVLVTGAASGMGKATAEVFAADGANVAVTDLTLETAKPVADAINKSGGRAEAWALDVGSPDSIKSVVAAVAERFGGIDALVNNAGISAFSPIDSADYDEVWD